MTTYQEVMDRLHRLGVDPILIRATDERVETLSKLADMIEQNKFNWDRCPSDEQAVIDHNKNQLTYHLELKAMHYRGCDICSIDLREITL